MVKPIRFTCSPSLMEVMQEKTFWGRLLKPLRRSLMKERPKTLSESSRTFRRFSKRHDTNGQYHEFERWSETNSSRKGLYLPLHHWVRGRSLLLVRGQEIAGGDQERCHVVAQ